MSHSSMKFDDFIRNLPVPAIDLVCKHLKTVQLITCSLLSENWKNAVSKTRNPNETALDIHFEPKCFQATVTFTNLPYGSFIVKYVEDSKVEFKTLLSSISSSQQIGTHSYSYRWSAPHLFTFAAPKFEVMEKDSLDMLHLIYKVFGPTLNEVVVKLDQNSSQFTDRILCSLPSGKARYLKLRSATDDVCLMKGETLKKILENVEFTGKIWLQTSWDTVFNSEQINLQTSSLIIDDARFLTQANLMNMRFYKGTIGTNTFRSEDFNMFFRQWKNKYVSNRLEQTDMKEAWFLISDNQEIDIAKVVHNLDATAWDPSVREKSKIIRFPERKWVNLENGYDLKNVNGMLATICIVEKQLVFLTWKDRFPLRTSQWRRERQMNSKRGYAPPYVKYEV